MRSCARMAPLPDFINLAPRQLQLAPCRAALGSLLSSGVSLLCCAPHCKHDTRCHNTVTLDKEEHTGVASSPSGLMKGELCAYPLDRCYGDRFLSSFLQGLSRAHIFCVKHASRRGFCPGTFSAFYIKQLDHQATEELSANLVLQPSKTCFAGRDSAAEVRSVSARIVTILVLRAFSCKTEVVSSCFLLVLKGLSFISCPVWRMDRHLHLFSAWVFTETCSSNFVKGVRCGSEVVGGDV